MGGFEQLRDLVLISDNRQAHSLNDVVLVEDFNFTECTLTFFVKLATVLSKDRQVVPVLAQLNQ